MNKMIPFGAIVSTVFLWAQEAIYAASTALFVIIVL